MSRDAPDAISFVKALRQSEFVRRMVYLPYILNVKKYKETEEGKAARSEKDKNKEKDKEHEEKKEEKPALNADVVAQQEIRTFLWQAKQKMLMEYLIRSDMFDKLFILFPVTCRDILLSRQGFEKSLQGDDVKSTRPNFLWLSVLLKQLAISGVLSNYKLIAEQENDNLVNGQHPDRSALYVRKGIEITMAYLQGPIKQKVNIFEKIMKAAAARKIVARWQKTRDVRMTINGVKIPLGMRWLMNQAHLNNFRQVLPLSFREVFWAVQNILAHAIRDMALEQTLYFKVQGIRANWIKTIHRGALATYVFMYFCKTCGSREKAFQLQVELVHSISLHYQSNHRIRIFGKMLGMELTSTRGGKRDYAPNPRTFDPYLAECYLQCLAALLAQMQDDKAAKEFPNRDESFPSRVSTITPTSLLAAASSIKDKAPGPGPEGAEGGDVPPSMPEIQGEFFLSQAEARQYIAFMFTRVSEEPSPEFQKNFARIVKSVKGGKVNADLLLELMAEQWCDIRREREKICVAAIKKSVAGHQSIMKMSRKHGAVCITYDSFVDIIQSADPNYPMVLLPAMYAQLLSFATPNRSEGEQNDTHHFVELAQNWNVGNTCLAPVFYSKPPDTHDDAELEWQIVQYLMDLFGPRIQLQFKALDKAGFHTRLKELRALEAKLLQSVKSFRQQPEVAQHKILRLFRSVLIGTYRVLPLNWLELVQAPPAELSKATALLKG